MLIAKPRGQGQAPYDVPSILNFNEFGDVEAYRDHSTHAAQSLLRVGEPQSHEIMVAVHNFVDAAIPSVWNSHGMHIKLQTACCIRRVESQSIFGRQRVSVARCTTTINTVVVVPSTRKG